MEEKKNIKEKTKPKKRKRTKNLILKDKKVKNKIQVKQDNLNKKLETSPNTAIMIINLSRLNSPMEKNRDCPRHI